MTKRRYILIGIPVACVISIIVSLVTFQPGKDTKSQGKHRIKRDIPFAETVRKYNWHEHGNPNCPGLTMPNYDEKGKEVLVMHGESTILLNNDVYKIISRN